MSRTIRNPPRSWRNWKPEWWHNFGTPTSSYRQMWRRQARTAIKRQHPDSVVTKISKLTSIYDWY